MTAVVFDANAGSLNHPTVCRRYEVGYYEGLDGDPWLATDAEAADEAHGIRWARVRPLFAVPGKPALFDIAGQVFDLDPTAPIVLREVPPW